MNFFLSKNDHNDTRIIPIAAYEYKQSIVLIAIAHPITTSINHLIQSIDTTTMQSRRLRAMNPAFAAAHGIESKESNQKSSSSTGNKTLEFILKRAQDTGKLVAASCPGLIVPLPDEVFRFPFGLSRFTEDLLTVVDFSDNEEQLGNSVLDKRILNFLSVRSLRFRNCGMKLPPPNEFSFSSLENLTILDLSGNKLDGRLDIGLLLWSPDKVSQLTELNLSNNQITEIVATSNESSVVSLPNLQNLNVSHNPQLERFLEETGETASFSCKNLRILRCHHNPKLSLTTKANRNLFSFLDACKSSLEVLEISNNPKLGTTIIDLSDYEQLQTVSLAMCKLEKIPRISHSVKTLDLNSNKLKSMEGMFSQAATSSQLVDLMFADNYLNELDPTAIESMSNLKRLDLTSNKIRTLPYQLGFLTDLSTLNISGNPVITRFSSLPGYSTNNPKPLLEKLRKRAPAQTSKANTGNSAASQLLIVAMSSKGNNTLDLAGKLLEPNSGGQAALDGLVGELKAKPAIDQGITSQILLDANRLETLPEDMLSLCLPNVQTISMTDNHLAELPSSLQSTRSKHVKQLRLGKNRLTSKSLEQAYWFRPVISSWSLRSLTHLDLSSNKLTSFPMDTASNINCFPALEFLNLFNNKISSLQDWKRLPESLIVLDLSENNIEDIEPLAILLTGCSSFQALSLVHNNIRRIPASLGLLAEYAPKVTSLNLQGNPQRGLPSHVLEKPCGELLKYLCNRLSPDQRRATIEKIECHLKSQKQESNRPVEKELAAETSSTTNQQENIPPSETATQMTAPSQSTTSQQIKNASTSKETSNCEEEEENHKVLKELQQSVEKLKSDLENLSLTQAKKYAVKKALAMERSKLIREERRLGLRK